MTHPQSTDRLSFLQEPTLTVHQVEIDRSTHGRSIRSVLPRVGRSVQDKHDSDIQQFARITDDDATIPDCRPLNASTMQAEGGREGGKRAREEDEFSGWLGGAQVCWVHRRDQVIQRAVLRKLTWSSRRLQGRRTVHSGWILEELSYSC